MRTIFTIFICLAAAAAFASDTVYTEGVDAFINQAVYTDLDGKPITGLVRSKANTRGGSVMEDERTVVNGQRNGPAKVWHNGRLLSEGEFLNGKLHGTLKRYNEDGQVVGLQEFKNGLFDGIGVSYNSDGTVRGEMIFREGQIVIGYMDNGDGQLEYRVSGGENKRFATCEVKENNAAQSAINEYTLHRDAFYDDVTQKYSDPEGNPITGLVRETTRRQMKEMEVKNGYLNGALLVYENGMLVSETAYKDGRRHGADTAFNKNGLPELTIYYAHGNIDGLVTAWRSDGSIIHEVIFRNGKAVSGYSITKNKMAALSKKELEDCEILYDSY